MEPYSKGFVEILSAEQKPTKNTWYQGTADAIRQNVEYLAEAEVDYFLILSGDQLYHMHFEEMVACAQETGADLVVAALPVDDAAAKRMGILKMDENQFIIHFVEKPQSKASLEPLKTAPHILEGLNITPQPDHPFLGSMGIYLFKRKVLLLI